MKKLNVGLEVKQICTPRYFADLQTLIFSSLYKILLLICRLDLLGVNSAVDF